MRKLMVAALIWEAIVETVCAATPGARAANGLGVDLYRKVAVSPGNVSLSPASIEIALGMTAAGAIGATADEMARVLHLNPTDQSALTTLGKTLGKASADACRISIANAIWPAKGKPIEARFVAKVREYDGDVTALDYAANPDTARKTINAWVSHKTEAKIPALLAPNTIKSNTPMVLTNAVYFKGDWQQPFHASDTQPGPFTTGRGETIQVPRMNQSSYFAYAVSGGAKILEMPYVGEQFAMMFVLPQKADGLPALEATLSPDVIDGWGAALKTDQAMISIPKFKVRWSNSLLSSLKALGLLLSTSDDADFSGMRAPPPPLKIGDVIHETFVLVDEKGTEAAAATAVIMAPGGAAPAGPPFEFIVDRPFLYLLRHIPTGAVLFLGRVVDPR